MKRFFTTISLLSILISCNTLQNDIDITTSTYKNIVQPAKLKPTENKLTVLQFNIWQEGTVVPEGFDAIIEEIIRTDADLIAFSEVRNYGGVDFNETICTALKEEGYTFYSFKSDDTGLLSKYQIIEETLLYPVKNDHGSITKAVVKHTSGTEIAFYSAHLDYKNCAYYDVRGYDGSTWMKKAPVTDETELKKINLASMRDDAIKAFITDANLEKEQGREIILGGDFNEPSHLDWLEENKNLFDHNGVTYQWDVSLLLQNAGFTDSYRELYPNPLTHPGFTYPSGNPKIPISRLTWAPKADERERIDFIYYLKDSKLKLIDSFVFGPDYSIAYSKPAQEAWEDQILLPGTETWPTDHKALISIFFM